MNEIVAGNPDLMRNATLKDWHDRINQGGKTALDAAIEVVYAFTGVAGPPIPGEAPTMNQERAYTSPIWYTPGG